jgi:hypothetical protein
LARETDATPRLIATEELNEIQRELSGGSFQGSEYQEEINRKMK